MKTIQKKVCMLGSFGVGKTSLVSQFVHSIFSEEYLTTIGVRIDRKEVELDSVNLNLVIWDLAGEDRFDHLQASYLAGASAFLLVVDGCRKDTLRSARRILTDFDSQLNHLPFICAVNKSDLRADWEVTEKDLEEMKGAGWETEISSARDKDSVETIFRKLARMIVKKETSSDSVSTPK